jgi:hypothetical protein
MGWHLPLVSGPPIDSSSSPSEGYIPHTTAKHSTMPLLTLCQVFFALNLVFNGVMWGLFTRALTLASSTIRVSIINTSANFIVTAVLSALIFSESLPGLWWLGAALLVAGSVIIGMRDEAEKKTVVAAGEALLLDRDGGATADSFWDEDENGDDERMELRGMASTDADSDEYGVLR